ncbi:uncharacterized protein [Diadema setosum]|uniref:uncharacterized protein n=1 Tax=Diadema setosum TaxID=31175 RepID=UPI003B3A49B3
MATVTETSRRRLRDKLEAGNSLCKNRKCSILMRLLEIGFVSRRRSVVGTIPTIQGWKGEDIRLPCDIQEDPFAVYWVKERTSVHQTEKATFLDGVFESREKRFNMDKNFSLIISDVEVADEGRYLCQVAVMNRDSFRNSTLLTVNSIASKHAIKECDEKTESYQSWCKFPSNTSSFNLTCVVSGFKPNISMQWTNGSGQILDSTISQQTTLSDGTYERFEIITVSVKREMEQSFMCSATGDSLNGTSTTEIIIPGIVDLLKGKHDSSLTVGLVVGLLLVGVIVILLSEMQVEIEPIPSTEPLHPEESIERNRLMDVDVHEANTSVENSEDKMPAGMAAPFAQKDDEEARDSLISLMTNKNSLVAQNMAPYPIYCSMLCFMWQNEGSRSVIHELKTFSKLFDLWIQLFKEHYAGKETNQEAQVSKLKQGDDCLQNFGKDAFYSLLRDELVFREKDLTASKTDLQTACDIGVLTRKECFVSCWESNKRKREHVVEYRIPHKLFQEYLAGIHLAWLFENNLEEFNQVKNQLIDDYRRYRYLLYFTAAQGLEVGKAVLGFLCEMLDVEDEDKLLFAIDVAFECNKVDALKPLIPHLNRLSSLHIEGSGHTTSGWIYALQACGFFASMRSDNRDLCDMADKDDSPASAALLAGRGICSLSNLRSMELKDVQLHDAFFTGMVSMASQSELQSIKHTGGTDITTVASESYAKSICTMPNLQTLELILVNIADDFFLALATSASGAKLQSIEHTGGSCISSAASESYAKRNCNMPDLQLISFFDVAIAGNIPPEKFQSIIRHGRADISPAASESYAKSICTMPNLQTLSLRYVNIAEGFFFTLATSATGAKLQSIKHTGGPDISPAASESYAKSICTMPNLQTLSLWNVSIADNFFLALATSAPGAKLRSITHHGGPDISPAASESYAKCICTMPNLQTLELDNVGIADDFFFVLATSASRAKIQSITHHGGPDISTTVSESYAKSICTMPNLQILELKRVKIAEDFFFALDTSASGAKLQSITHHGGPDISPAASESYAKCICVMPNLQTLKLKRVKIADDFFLALDKSASGAKIQRLELFKASISASILHSILHLPYLSFLTVRDVNNEVSMSHLGSNEEEADNESDFVRSPIIHVGVDDKSLSLLKQLNVVSLCPNVEKVCVKIGKYSSYLDIDKAWPLYSHNLELNLQGNISHFVRDRHLRQSLLAPPTVTRLSVMNELVGNEEAKKLIRSLSSYHHLKDVSVIRCNTSEDLDPFCREVNAEGRLLISVEHGEPKYSKWSCVNFCCTVCYLEEWIDADNGCMCSLADWRLMLASYGGDQS